MVKFQKYEFNRTDLKLADLLCEIHNFYTECLFQISTVQNLDRIRKNKYPNYSLIQRWPKEKTDSKEDCPEVYFPRYFPPLISLKRGLIQKIPSVTMYTIQMRTTYLNIILIQRWKVELQLSDVRRRYSCQMFCHQYVFSPASL